MIIHIKAITTNTGELMSIVHPQFLRSPMIFESILNRYNFSSSVEVPKLYRG